MNDREQTKLDRGQFWISELARTEEEHYWWGKTPVQRLAALELMRQSMYGYDPTRTRLKRVFAVASLGED